MSARRKAAYTVFIAAEGPSEMGELAGAPQWRGAKAPREGYFQPMLRKLLGEDVAFVGQKITVLRRDDEEGLPGHADKAAIALRIASTVEGCRMVVFAHDVDKASSEKRNARERARRVERLHAEIEAGFAAVEGAGHVLRIKATPLRMLEAWALGDAAAIRAVRGKGIAPAALPAHPEETWGDKKQPGSGHPKCLLRRALGRDPTPQDFADLAENADVEVLRTSCPASFAPFVKEAERARDEVACALALDG